MLPDETANVLSVGSRLAPEARRVRGVANRQLASVEDFAAMQVRERHFRGRHEIQVPVARDLEQVRLELRQISGAGQRRGVDQERRLHFAVAMLARMEI